MPFSSQHKCLFIHIPRTAGTSFRVALGIREATNSTPAYEINGDFELRPKDETKVPLSIQLHHLCMKHIQLLGVLDHSLLAESFKCAFVRNPWNKTLSEYSHYYHKYCVDFEDYVLRLEKIVLFVNENFVFDFNNNFYKEYSDLMLSIFGLAPTWKGVIFEQFYIKDHPFAKELTWVDPHFFPQHFFVADELGNNLMNFIGRFENYRRDAQNILDRLNICSSISHLNSSKHLDYREVYNLKTRDIVYNLFKKDIQTFDYTF
jgi:hypothetical protein